MITLRLKNKTAFGHVPRIPRAVVREKLAYPVAKALLAGARERLQKRGKDATGNTYALKSKYRIVPNRYKVKGGESLPSGTRKLPRELLERHRGTFDRSGGMWRGVHARPVGRGAAVRLRRSSIGQTPRYVGESDNRIAKHQRVSNNLKARTVLDRAKVNIVQAAEDERAQACSAVLERLAAAAARQQGATIPWQRIAIRRGSVYRRARHG